MVRALHEQTSTAMEFETLINEELTSLATRLAAVAAAERTSAVDEAINRVQSQADAEIARLRSEAAEALAQANETANATIAAAQAASAAAIAEAEAASNLALAAAQADATAAIAAAQAESAAAILAVQAEAAMQAEAAAAAEQARIEAHTALTQMAAEKDAVIEQLTRDLDTRLRETRAEHEAAVLAARAEAEDDGSRLKADLAAETARIREMADAAIAEASLAAAADIAHAKAAADLNAARAHAAESELVAIRAAASAATKTNSTFGSMIETLRDRQTQLAAENERLAAENAAYSYERQDLLDRAASGSASPAIAPLAATFDRMAVAASVDDVLAAAAEGLGDGMTRVALFSVRDNRLLPAFHRGFDANSGIDKVVIPLGVDSFLSTAAHRQTLHVLRGAEQTAAAPFGGSSQLVMTAALAVRGETLAVLYGDDSGSVLTAAAIEEQLAQVRILLAYAALRLDRLTTELKAVAELKAYAQMLVDEAEYVYQADLSSKKPDSERTMRLAENIRCARQIYRQRVTLEGPAAAALLDEVLRETVERKAATTFGRELQKAVAGTVAAPAQHRTAQAS